VAACGDGSEEGGNGREADGVPRRSDAPPGTPIAPEDPGPDAVLHVDLDGLLPEERQAVWDPGLNSVGGIPRRETICQTLEPSSGDDTGAIQEALDTCPDGQVVQLEAGEFQITGEGLFLDRSNITLRGAGPDKTRLVKPEGTDYAAINLGIRWFHYTGPVDLSTDAPQGSTSIELAGDHGLEVGEIVTIDQLTDPEITYWHPEASPPGHDSRSWFSREDRPVGQVLEVKSVEGRTVEFTTPLHLAYLTANEAQVFRFSTDPDFPPEPVVKYSGVEDLYVYGGEGGDGGGNIRLTAAAYCWIRNVEAEGSLGTSIVFDGTFRCELRDSYIHSTRDPNPGGGGYGVGMADHAADNLVENNVVWNFNKVMVMRASGGGNVIAYNYMEDGWGAGYPDIPEVGLNAAHMTTPHHELFEGNQSWNFGSDSLWGNSVYITVFRNHLTGERRSVAPLELTDDTLQRVVSLTTAHWWYSFVGNVLGTPGQTSPTGFVYELERVDDDTDAVPVWILGYDGEDPGATRQDDMDSVQSSTIRHGNFDFVTDDVVWDPDITTRELPASLYLTEKPEFFEDNPWPWVTPEDEGAVVTLPARERFDRIHGL
jgi:hypothetical protein